MAIVKKTEACEHKDVVPCWIIPATTVKPGEGDITRLWDGPNLIDEFRHYPNQSSEVTLARGAGPEWDTGDCAVFVERATSTPGAAVRDYDFAEIRHSARWWLSVQPWTCPTCRLFWVRVTPRRCDCGHEMRVQ